MVNVYEFVNHSYVEFATNSVAVPMLELSVSVLMGMSSWIMCGVCDCFI